MRKSLRVLAAATVMTMLMSTAAYADPVTADPGTKYQFDTIDGNSKTVNAQVAYWHMTEEDLLALPINYGAGWDSDVGGLIRSAKMLSPGCDIYYIAESFYYSDKEAWGPQKAMGVTGSDVLGVERISDDVVKQLRTSLVGENYERYFTGNTVPYYKYTLNNNGVPVECYIYGNYNAVGTFGVTPGGYGYGDNVPSDWYHLPHIYAVAVPHGYVGDLFLTAVPFGWEDRYTGGTGTMDGVAKMIGANSRGRLGDAVSFPITGSQVKPNTTVWDSESLTAQAEYASGRTPLWLQQ